MSESKNNTFEEVEVIETQDKALTELNTSHLTEGLVVKNYKSMCSLLECDVCGGDSKKSQLKNWKRYFNYEKSGQKFMITEIYDTPFPSEDARKLKEGLYVKYIELLLLKYLSSCEVKFCPYPTLIIAKSIPEFFTSAQFITP